MKTITVTQNVKRTTEMVVGLNTQHNLCAKINSRGKDSSELDIDILCTDRSERDLIETLLKKKRYKMSDGLRTREDFTIQSRGGQKGWTEHVMLHGPKSEKMLKLICETFEVKLPESNFYMD